jgi:hypothetical protein
VDNPAFEIDYRESWLGSAIRVASSAQQGAKRQSGLGTHLE